jgi:hypothetical protein
VVLAAVDLLQVAAALLQQLELRPVALVVMGIFTRVGRARLELEFFLVQEVAVAVILALAQMLRVLMVEQEEAVVAVGVLRHKAEPLAQAATALFFYGIKE